MFGAKAEYSSKTPDSIKTSYRDFLKSKNAHIHSKTLSFDSKAIIVMETKIFFIITFMLITFIISMNISLLELYFC